MNILIVTQYFWPENCRINDLAESLFEIGHNVTVLTGLPNYPEGKLYRGYRWRITKESHHNINLIRIPLIMRGEATNLRLFFNYASFAMFASIFSPFIIKMLDLAVRTRKIYFPFKRIFSIITEIPWASH